MNFSVDSTSGIGYQTWTLATDIRTNIWYSLNIDYGRFWQQPTFGNKLYLIKKLSDSNVLLARQYVEEALAWLIQVGRATSISVTCARSADPRTPGRLDIEVKATQPDGLIISYTQWYNVI